jgi:hypothetical protein
MVPADKLRWSQADFGNDVLLYEDRVVVGKAWIPVDRRPAAAWSAGSEKGLRVPDSGVQAAANLDEAKSTCQMWVMMKAE